MSIEKMNFKRWVHKVLPAVYDESLSYYELLCKITAKLNEVIEQGNTTSEGLKELQDYVANYFENLDVQEEINNKLDEMAESGQLTDIIAQYLELAGVLAYNTKAQMKQAKNLVEGSICKTLGNTSYQDGQGAFYKVREVQNTDVIDDENIIALSDPDLVAEKIQYSSGYDIQTNLQEQIDDINDNLLSELVVVGDSYTALEGSNWAELVAQQLGLNLHKHATSSMGFVHEVGGHTFVDNLDWGETTTQKNRTKYVICYGGINDKSENKTDLYNNVKTFCSTAKTTYPNAQIIIVGPQTSATNYLGYQDTINAIQKGASASGVAYANAFDWLFINQFSYSDTYASDNIHPSELGYKIIASKMLNLLNGSIIQNNLIDFSFANNLTGTIRVSQNNNLCSLVCVIDSVEMQHNSFTTILNTNVPFKEFIPGNQYFPVYGISTYGFANKMIGFASFNSDYTAIRVVNITGSTVTSKIGFRADIMTSATN